MSAALLAALAGAAAGGLHAGALRVEVTRLLAPASSPAGTAALHVARLGAVALALALMARAGPGALAAGLAGFTAAVCAAAGTAR